MLWEFDLKLILWLPSDGSKGVVLRMIAVGTRLLTHPGSLHLVLGFRDLG
ncbi:hypothetical protein GCM10009119_06180 [Algoriphagus jejuensis]|uniref:Uncharacterized protein n=1 Tax=Algoriphagus jejuensis TaxID=419934 RepID=A0ABN1MX15_9BACT